MKIITVQEMRRLEKGSGIPLEQLMLSAGCAAAREVLRFTAERCVFPPVLRYVVVAGKGNNGGDGMAVARCLASWGHAVSVYTTIPLADYAGTATSQSRDFPAAIPCQTVTELPPEAFLPGTVLIDALLGIGVSGNPRGVVAGLIRQLNESGLPVLALDIPSGLDADTGLGTPCVQADLTITMAYPKRGMFLEQGPQACGLVRVVPIGVEKMPVDGVALAYTEAEARRDMPRRPVDCHKNCFGHLLVLAGAREYPGAPFLAAEGGLRCGAGLVTLATPEEAVTRPGPAALILQRLHGDHLDCGQLPSLEDILGRCTAIVFGPGIGRSVPAAFLEALLERPKPLLIDAEGLRLLAANPQLLPKLRRRESPVVLTPHPGEMQALLEEFGLCADCPADKARSLAAHCHGVVVLKGHNSLVAEPDGTLTINCSGGPALATAGSGDVLAGMAGAFLAQGLPPATALRLAVFIHGHAGDLWPYASAAMIADDLLTLIPKALIFR